MNKKVKETAWKGNFFSNPSLVDVKMGPDFESKLRKTFQPFIADHVSFSSKIICFVLRNAFTDP